MLKEPTREVTPEDFLQHRAGLWEHVLNEGGVKKILSVEKGQWRLVEKELTQAVDNSLLGAKLFKHAALPLLREKARSVMKKHLGLMDNLESISENDFIDVQSNCLEDLEALPGAEKLLTKLDDEEVMFRGIGLRMPVHSLHGWMELSFAAWLRTRAVAMGGVQALPGECELSLESLTAVTQIDAKLLADIKSSRSATLSHLACEEVVDCSTAEAMLKRHRAALLSMDRFFVVDFAWMQTLGGDKVLNMLCDRIAGLLPSSTRSPSYDEVQDGLKAILKSKIYPFRDKSRPL
mmetsp:Transcript_54776/g.130633  ORF Transcript_54776/g.130633 Transcript_54776/m.130633 type:complete len:292 (+) Transcript_54776:327-1202(+)